MMQMNEQKQKIRNRKLFKLLKDLTESFMNALDKPFFSAYGSWYDRIKTLLQGNSELIAKILEKRHDLKEKELSRCLLSAQRCLKTLLGEDLCRNPPHASIAEGYQDELTWLLERLFKERERIRIRALFAKPQALARHFDDVFLREYLRYENYLYDDSVSDFLICPLQNFISSKTIELKNQLAIRRITQEEFHGLVEAEERHRYELESYPEYVLYVPIDDENWREQIEGVITSLRLLKKERVGLTRIYYGYALPCRPWKIIEAPAGTKFIEKLAGAFFTLISSEEEELKKLFTLLDRTKEAGYLAMSMRRFNFAFERERLEDSWIDLFVSLESLYSKASEMTEVMHRLATRLSRALVGDSLDDRKRIRNKIKKWYGIRSKIVHGQKVNLTQKQLQDLEEILRKSLKWFMTHQEYADHDKVIDLLDLSS